MNRAQRRAAGRVMCGGGVYPCDPGCPVHSDAADVAVTWRSIYAGIFLFGVLVGAVTVAGYAAYRMDQMHRAMLAQRTLVREQAAVIRDRDMSVMAGQSMLAEATRLRDEQIKLRAEGCK